MPQSRFPNSSGFPLLSILPFNLWSLGPFVRKCLRLTRVAALMFPLISCSGEGLPSVSWQETPPGWVEVNSQRWAPGWRIVELGIWSGSKLIPIRFLLPSSSSQARETVPRDCEWEWRSQLLVNSLRQCSSQLGVALDILPSLNQRRFFRGQERQFQANRSGKS